MLRIEAQYLEARNEAQKLDLETMLKNFTNKTLRTFCRHWHCAAVLFKN